MKKFFLLFLITIFSSYASANTTRIIVSYPPGGASDAIARLIQSKLNEQGETVIVINMPSGQGVVAVNEVYNAIPDGNTILFSGSGPILFKPYDNIEQANKVSKLTPLIHVSAMPSVIIAGKKSGITSWKQLQEEIKRRYINIGISSSAGGGIIDVTLNNPNVKKILFNGDAPAILATISDTVDVSIVSYSSAVSQIESGNVVALALTDNSYPDDPNNIKTLKQLGTNFNFSIFYGMFLPPDTPPKIQDALYKKINAILSSPEAKKLYKSRQITLPDATNYNEFSKLLFLENKKWSTILQVTHDK